MTYQLQKCPSCGGPLVAASFDGFVCPFCDTELRAEPGAQYRIPAPLDETAVAPHRARVSVAGVRYCVLGRLAQGDGCDVFLARRDARLTEMVVMKVPRVLEDTDLARREWQVLGEIEQSGGEGADHFLRLLPQRVLQGTAVRGDGPGRLACVYRWRSGFQFTGEHALAQYPGGIDPRAAVWIWKRVLELLGWLHGNGFVYGAVLPPHLLLHPRDHGVVLCGWSSAARDGEPRAAISAAWEGFYPEGAATAAADVTMSARCLAYLLGAGKVPGPLAELVGQVASGGKAGDAWGVNEKLDAAARAAFGPPRYRRFLLSGWG